MRIASSKRWRSWVTTYQYASILAAAPELPIPIEVLEAAELRMRLERAACEEAKRFQREHAARRTTRPGVRGVPRPCEAVRKESA